MSVSDRPPVAALVDAVTATRALLWPVRVGRWAKLVPLAFLVGGLGGAEAAGGNVPVSIGAPGSTAGAVPAFPDPGVGPQDVPPLEEILTVLGLVVAGVVTLVLVYALVGAVSEFVVFVAVRDGRVTLRRSVRDHFWQGVRLFLFRVGVWTAALVVGLLPAAAAVGLGVVVEPLAGLLAIPALLVLVLTLVPAWILLTLTTDFVVPTMIATGAAGPASGWGRLRPVLRRWPLDVVGYVVAKFVIGATANVVVGVVATILAALAGVPFTAGASAYLSSAGDPLSWTEFAVLLGIAVTYSGVSLGLLVVARTPVVVYFRAYALATLGRFDADLDRDLLGVHPENANGADGDADGDAADDPTGAATGDDATDREGGA